MDRGPDQDDSERDVGVAASSGSSVFGTPEQIAAAVEAVLLTVDKSLPAAKLAAAVGVDRALPAGVIESAVEDLNAAYERTGRSFRIESVAGGYRIMTLGVYAPAVAAAHGVQGSTRLSRAAIETLAIVAYRQPITRASVEAIRGVACGEVLRTWLEKKLVTIAGRAEELGRPMLYGTTPRFLEAFGLASIQDLPAVGDLFPGMDEVALGSASDEQPDIESDVSNAEPEDVERVAEPGPAASIETPPVSTEIKPS